MAATLTWIVFIVGIFALAYHRASPRNWLILSAILLILFSAFATLWVAIGAAESNPRISQVWP